MKHSKSTKTLPKISVIMAVANGMPFLKDAVESIFAQTYKNFEFIIVDDASVDQTSKYLNSLKDHRIKIITNKKNLGLSTSLNEALKMAKGEYIARMDADDISLPKRFETQIKFLKSNPAISLCGTWAKLIDEKNNVIGNVHKPLEDLEIKKMNLRLTGVIHPSWIAKSEVYKKLKSYDPDYDFAEDLDFLIRAKSYKMANIGEELLLWRSPQKRRSQRNIQEMYRKSLAVRWNHFRKGLLSPMVIPYLLRSLITTFLFPTQLKIFLNKKAGLI